MSRFFIFMVVACCICITLTAGCANQKAAGPLGNNAALINGEPVTNEKLNVEMEKQFGEQIRKVKIEILNGLVNLRLVDQEANKLGVNVSDKDVEDLKAKLQLHKDYWEGIEAGQVKVEELTTKFKYLLQLQGIALKDVPKADKEAFFEQKKEELTLYHPYIIVVKTEEEAKEIKAALDKGEDFAALAEKYLEIPVLKKRKGDLGLVMGADINSPDLRDIMTLIHDMKPGEWKGPETMNGGGFLFIRLADKLDTYEKVDYLVDMGLTSEKEPQLLKELREKAKIVTIFDENIEKLKEKTKKEEDKKEEEKPKGE